MNQAGDDLESAVRQCPVIRWQGIVWRMHRRKYHALDPTGTRVTSGRYHRAPAQFPQDQTWPAIYLSLVPEVTIGEVLRNTPTDRMSALNTYRLSEVTAHLAVVVDCRVLVDRGISAEDLLKEGDFALTQEIAQHALSHGAEAILVPSATRLGDNLVVFPNQLTDGSWLEVVGSRDPVLYVERG